MMKRMSTEEEAKDINKKIASGGLFDKNEIDEKEKIKKEKEEKEKKEKEEKERKKMEKERKKEEEKERIKKEKEEKERKEKEEKERIKKEKEEKERQKEEEKQRIKREKKEKKVKIKEEKERKEKEEKEKKEKEKQEKKERKKAKSRGKEKQTENIQTNEEFIRKKDKKKTVKEKDLKFDFENGQISRETKIEDIASEIIDTELPFTERGRLNTFAKTKFELSSKTKKNSQYQKVHTMTIDDFFKADEIFSGSEDENEKKNEKNSNKNAQKELLDQEAKFAKKIRDMQLRFLVIKRMATYREYYKSMFEKFRRQAEKVAIVDYRNRIDFEKNKKIFKIISTMIDRQQRTLSKCFMRFYFNTKFKAAEEKISSNVNLPKLEIFNKKNIETNEQNEEKETEEENNNEEENDNEENNNSENKNEENNNIKNDNEENNNSENKNILEEKPPEIIGRLKFSNKAYRSEEQRQREIKELFYNKIRERKAYLQKKFSQFYYKGLIASMKRQSTTAPPTTQNENNKTEEKKEEPKQPVNPVKAVREKSRGLRAILSKKNREKQDILKKYFYLFLSRGIMASMRKKVNKKLSGASNIPQPIKEVKEENKESKSSDSDSDENEENESKNENNENDEKNENDENDENKEKNEEEEKERKMKKKEEKKRKKELKAKRIEILTKIVSKKDRIVMLLLKTFLQKWNLRTKILSMLSLQSSVGGGKVKKKGKKKGKKMKSKKNNDDKDKKVEDLKEENEQKEENEKNE